MTEPTTEAGPAWEALRRDIEHWLAVPEEAWRDGGVIGALYKHRPAIEAEARATDSLCQAQYAKGLADGRAEARATVPDVDDVTMTEALAVLARHGRVIAILVPRGVDSEDVKEITAAVNARLDELVARRGPMA